MYTIFPLLKNMLFASPAFINYKINLKFKNVEQIKNREYNNYFSAGIWNASLPKYPRHGVDCDNSSNSKTASNEHKINQKHYFTIS